MLVAAEASLKADDEEGAAAASDAAGAPLPAIPLVRPQSSGTGGGPMEPDPAGLAWLRSPALADRPLRVAAVVGQARSGKSYFMNSIIGTRQRFTVGSSQVPRCVCCTSPLVEHCRSDLLAACRRASLRAFGSRICRTSASLPLHAAAAAAAAARARANHWARRRPGGAVRRPTGGRRHC